MSLPARCFLFCLLRDCSARCQSLKRRRSQSPPLSVPITGHTADLPRELQLQPSNLRPATLKKMDLLVISPSARRRTPHSISPRLCSRFAPRDHRFRFSIPSPPSGGEGTWTSRQLIYSTAAQRLQEAIVVYPRCANAASASFAVCVFGARVDAFLRWSCASALSFSLL
jgi:hypothetical protein